MRLTPGERSLTFQPMVRHLQQKVRFLEREREYLAKGGKFIFPMPEIEII